MVLGFSWLQRHNPLINWSTGAIMGWSPFCHAHCLKSAQPAPGRLSRGSVGALDLLPSTTSPRGGVYSLSGLETKAMETYIGESLAAVLLLLPSVQGSSLWRRTRPCTRAGSQRHSSEEQLPATTPLLGLRVAPGGHRVFKAGSTEHLVWIRERDEWKTAFNTANTSIWSYHLFLPTPLICFRLWSMMFSVRC